MYKYFLKLQTFVQKYFYLFIRGNRLTLLKIITHDVQTAKEKVLSLYPMAYCEWDYNVSETHAFRYYIKNKKGGDDITIRFNTPEQAWENIANKITSLKHTQTNEN